MVGHFHNTFARSELHAFNNKRTNTYQNSTLLWALENKNHAKYFLSLGWSVGKYPHSFGIETGIEINVAASSTCD